MANLRKLAPSLAKLKDEIQLINIKHDTASSGNTDLLIGVGYFINLIINAGRKFVLFILTWDPCCKKVLLHHRHPATECLPT
jgi:hypothetical protein